MQQVSPKHTYRTTQSVNIQTSSAGLNITRQEYVTKWYTFTRNENVLWFSCGCAYVRPV